MTDEISAQDCQCMFGSYGPIAVADVQTKVGEYVLGKAR
jgi:hypothetical protein